MKCDASCKARCMCLLSSRRWKRGWIVLVRFEQVTASSSSRLKRSFLFAVLMRVLISLLDLVSASFVRGLGNAMLLTMQVERYEFLQCGSGIVYIELLKTLFLALKTAYKAPWPLLQISSSSWQSCTRQRQLNDIVLLNFSNKPRHNVNNAWRTWYSSYKQHLHNDDRTLFSATNTLCRSQTVFFQDCCFQNIRALQYSCASVVVLIRTTSKIWSDASPLPVTSRAAWCWLGPFAQTFRSDSKSRQFMHLNTRLNEGYQGYPAIFVCLSNTCLWSRYASATTAHVDWPDNNSCCYFHFHITACPVQFNAGRPHLPLCLEYKAIGLEIFPI